MTGLSVSATTSRMMWMLSASRRCRWVRFMGSSVVDVRGVMKGRPAAAGDGARAAAATAGVGESGSAAQRRRRQLGGSRRPGGARRAGAIGQASTCSRGCVAIQSLSCVARPSVQAVQPGDDRAGRLRLQAREEVDVGVLQAQRRDRQPGDLAARVDGHQQPARAAAPRPARAGRRTTRCAARRRARGADWLRLEPLRAGGRALGRVAQRDQRQAPAREAARDRARVQLDAEALLRAVAHGVGRPQRPPAARPPRARRTAPAAPARPPAPASARGRCLAAGRACRRPPHASRLR